jgi:hypothetical protein
MIASESGRQEVVKALIAAGADAHMTDKVFCHDYLEKTPTCDRLRSPLALYRAEVWHSRWLLPEVTWRW